MDLTSKQRKHLRGLGQTLEPIMHVGKDGVSDECIAATEETFNRRELIKVRVLKNCPDETADAAAELAEATSSKLISKVGFTFLLYKPNETLKEQIKLP